VKELRSLLIESFDLEELHSLCFDLGINFDSLAGSTIDSKARELIAYCQRHLRLPDLLAACRQHRPHIAWPDFPEQTDVHPTATASHIHTYLTGKIEALQKQINIFYELPEFPTHDEQLLVEAIQIVQREDEVLFTKSGGFYHDVPAQLRAWANPIGLPQPPFTCMAFLNLANGSQIIARLEKIRSSAPTAVFILYATPAEYEQCLQTLPAEWAGSFGHYYKLFKKEGLQLAADVRKILDEARITALRKMEMQIVQEQL
jgi:hypothetical protein